MSTTMTLKGTFHFAFKKLLAGGEMTMSRYKGPGEILLAPSVLGDIIVLRVNGNSEWKIGRDSFLASTDAVEHKYQAQSISKGVFSGEGLFIYKITGDGLLWVQSFGAIIKKDVSSLISKNSLEYPLTKILGSFEKEKTILSTMAILLHGTASTRLNVLHPAV